MRERSHFPRFLVFLLWASIACPSGGIVARAGEKGAKTKETRQVERMKFTVTASALDATALLGHKGIKDKRLMESLLQEAKALGFHSIDQSNIGNIRFLGGQFMDYESESRFRLLQNRVNYALIFNLEPSIENLTKTIRSKGDHRKYHFGCIAALETLNSLPDQELRGIATEDIQACFDRHEEWLVKTGCVRLITKIDRKTGFRNADEFMRNENVTLRAKVFLAMGLIRYDYLGGYPIMKDALCSLDPMVRSNVPVLMAFFERKDGEQAGNVEIDTAKLISETLAKVDSIRGKLSNMKTEREAKDGN